MTDIIIDPARLDDLRALGDQLVRDMLRLFLEYVPERLVALDAAIGAGDLDTARREAHATKSSAGNIGANALHSAANELEQAAHAGKADELPALRDEVKASYQAAEARCRELLAELAG